MAAADVLNVEDSLRTLALTKGIRVNQFFKDYDNLRSGYVTRGQFFRCLGQTLGIKLTPQQEIALENKYNLCNSNRLNYRVFCDEINRSFQPQQVHQDPYKQEVHPQKYLGSERTQNQLDPDQETKLDSLIQRLRDYYQYHQLSIRTAYKDFDVHNVGAVTETQFYRNFPGPSDVDEKEKQLLVYKYRDPKQPGFINYLNFERDLQNRAIIPPTEDMRQSVINPYVFDRSINPTFNDVLDKIRIAVYKNGIRTTDYFKDYDSLRHGVITENQFVCAMVLCVGKEAQLTRPEIQQIVEFYREPDGRVRYKEFIDMMENVFNDPHLEKTPLKNVERPAKGTLHRALAPLSDSEEQKIQKIVNKLATEVRKRRIELYQYFKDFDRSVAYTRLMTPSQFYRTLHFLTLDVPEQEHKLLCRKFADPGTGDVNYPAFVQAIDQQYVGHTTEVVDTQNAYHRGRVITPPKPLPEPLVTFEELIARIRHHVMTNRLRTAMFFEDFDELRSGSITKSRFQRCLGLLGLSKLGKHDLTPGQFEMLCKRYQDPDKADNVIWTDFVNDIECVFTIPNLEVAPTLRVPEQDVYKVPRPGTADWERADDVHKTMIDDVIRRLKDKVSQRRVLCKPTFHDFDKHNRGLITPNQFRQCLNMLDLKVTESEMKALEARYNNDEGFSYLEFLDQIDYRDPEVLMYMNRMAELRAINTGKDVPEFKPCCNLEELLLKLKSIVKRKRMRPVEFMKDFDKLRSGRVPKQSFRRALDISGYGLQESEIAILEDKYQSTKSAEYVEYHPFCDELESVFTTKNLEKMPTLDCCQFTPPDEWMMNELQTDTEEPILEDCLVRIAEKVKQRRMQLFPLFEDYDLVNSGYISQSQFYRVLTQLDLGGLIGIRDYNLLLKRFEVRNGGRNDFNYKAFCDVINPLAGLHPRLP